MAEDDVDEKGGQTRRGRKRASAARKPTAARRKVTPGDPSVDGKPWSFPKHTLEDAIRIAKAIEEKHAGNPMKADLVARAVGFGQPTDWRFRDLLKAANMYGLVSGSGATATVSDRKSVV